MSGNLSGAKLAGQRAVVTGAARGIGAACAEILAEQGASVILTDRLAEEGAAMAARIRDAGGDAAFEALDVADPDQWAAKAPLIAERLGGLDILVNNAGISEFRFIPEISLEDFRRTSRTNLYGAFAGLKWAASVMGEGGRIVQIASIVSLTATIGVAPYAAAKGAMRGLTRAAAMELAPRGIRVNSVLPGIIWTDMVKAMFGARETAEERFRPAIPFERMGEPRDIAEGVAFLCDPASSFVTGAELVIDGGFTAR